MARPQKYTAQQVKEALLNSHGLKTGAAELLGADFETIDAYCKRYAMCQKVVDHWRKRRKDRAEYKLDDAIERGDSWAIMFTLKNAHDREYNERIVMTIEKMSDDELAKAIGPYLARIGARLESPAPKRLDAAPEQPDGDGGAV